MPVSYNTGDYTISQNRLRAGDKVVPVWFPKGGFIFNPFPGEIHSQHRLADVAEVSSVTTTFVNERELFQVGMERATVNDGKSFGLTLTVEGNALEAKAILAGIDLHEYAAVEEGQVVTAAGHLALLSATPDGTIQFCTFLPNCEVKLTDIPGATDGNSTMSIEVTSRSSVYTTTGQLIPIREIWFAGTSWKDGSTSITNTAAPNGTNTTFKLGSGNNSGLTDTPLAVAYNKLKAGTAQEYILEYKLSDSASTAFTYNSATGVITPSSTLAAATKLEVLYFVRAGALSWDETKRYGIGEIVSHEGAYYQAVATVTAGTTPSSSNPWSDYEGFGVASGGGSGVGTPLIPFNAGDRYDFMESWNDNMIV